MNNARDQSVFRDRHRNLLQRSPPPHFHAKYGEHSAKIDVATGAVLDGSLPNRVMGLVEEGRHLHQVELEDVWAKIRDRLPYEKITPLERAMLPKVIDARHAGDHRVWLRFADGLSGGLDLSDDLWGAVFEPLKEVTVFAQLRVDPDLDTIAWPNGADLSPQWLHDQLTTRVNAAAAE